jgi:hypothetical protein
LYGTLDLVGEPDSSHPAHLEMNLYFYRRGIMRGLIQESNSTRFRISKEGLPIEELHLLPYGVDEINITLMEDRTRVWGPALQDGDEEVVYDILEEPFTIIQRIDGLETMILNPNSTSLYIEDGSQK